MNRFVVVFVTLAVSGVLIVRADEKGLKEIEGTYKLVSAERDGKSADKAVIEAITVTIQGDEFVLAFSANDRKVAKIKVTPDSKLSTIDLSPQDGENKGKTYPGIYKIEGGQLTLAFSEKGERPKEFKSDNEVVVLVLKKTEK